MSIAPGWLRFATIDTRPLRHRDFRLLLSGQLITLVGGEITFVAIPYQVFQLTHSPFATGLLGVFEVVPLLGLAFLGGAFADAHDRRAIVLLTELGFAATSLLLVVNAAQPTPSLWVVYVLAGVQAGLRALQRPSLDAMLPRLVPGPELTAASALVSLGGSLGMVVGPSLGGVLLATIGLPATYGIDLASFAVSLGALALMRPVPPLATAQPPSLRRIAEGVRYARGRPELVGTYVVDLVAMFFGMPSALFPAVAESFGGPAVLGLLYAAPATGALLAAATSGWTSRVSRHGLMVILAAVTWGAAIALFGLMGSLWPALALLAVAGGADAISGIFRMVIWNQTIPDELRGRLASIEMLSYSTGPMLGNVESGLVASLFSVRASIVSGGLLCVVGCVACAALLPAFRDYDARASRPAD
jgi:MFS family permease